MRTIPTTALALLAPLVVACQAFTGTGDLEVQGAGGQAGAGAKTSSASAGQGGGGSGSGGMQAGSGGGSMMSSSQSSSSSSGAGCTTCKDAFPPVLAATPNVCRGEPKTVYDALVACLCEDMGMGFGCTGGDDPNAPCAGLCTGQPVPNSECANCAQSVCPSLYDQCQSK